MGNFAILVLGFMVAIAVIAFAIHILPDILRALVIMISACQDGMEGLFEDDDGLIRHVPFFFALFFWATYIVNAVLLYTPLSPTHRGCLRWSIRYYFRMYKLLKRRR